MAGDAKAEAGIADDERQRARPSLPQARPAVQPGMAPAVRTGTDDSGR